MANDVFANGREIACKKAEGKSTCAFPDVCMTPPENPATPAGVPVPYPNTGYAKDTTKGSKTVKISGQEVMLKNKSYFKQSTGDEAGSATKKGVATGVNKGKVYFNSWSMNVKIEGKNVVRHLDLTTHNHDASQPGQTLPWPYTDSMCMVPEEENQEKERYFIAVADRGLKGFGLGLFFHHYSVQYWRCDEDVPVGEEMSVDDLESRYPSATKLKSVELLRDNAGWEVWTYTVKIIPAPFGGWIPYWVWEVKGVSVSVIHFSDEGEDLLVLRQGFESDIKPIWDKIESNAANYRFAEQEGFNGNFAHWPNSKYQMPGNSPFNNSNTFVRFVVTQAGLTMTELSGSHPGANEPTDVPDKYGGTPWRAGKKPPPKPTNPP